MASACCSMATLAGVTSPMMRTATRAGNGWRHDLRGQAQLLAHPAHLVLEQRPQRLDQLERHVLGQAAHVVVALDGRGAVAPPDSMTSGYSVPCTRNRASSSPGRLLEDADEQLADDLALVLGVGDAGQPLEVAVGRPHVDQLDVLVAAERVDHLLALALAEQARVDEHAVSWAPTLCTSAAATAESTRPTARR